MLPKIFSKITKSDLKTIVSKASRDNKFNAIKNALAKDILSFLQKSEYIGWRTVIKGKHEESAYFAYFNRELGVRTILAMRKIKNGGPYKPYAIEIDQTTKDFEAGNWYTLDGRRLNGKPTKKGIYIVNGRKVVIK